MRLIVTGLGPRCGTSAMMKRLIDKGYDYVGAKFPMHSVAEFNPEGYFEPELTYWNTFEDNSLGLFDNHCIKAFPGHLCKFVQDEVDLIIVMYRKDFHAQIDSILRCGKAEGVVLSRSDAVQLVHRSKKFFEKEIKRFPHVKIETLQQDQVETYL